MPSKKITLYSLVLLLLWSVSVSAQDRDTAPEDAFYPDLQADEDMKMLRAIREPLSISYGGWITPVIIDERSGTALTSSVTISKLWIKSTLWRNSYVYIRGKDVFFYVVNEEDIDIDDTENLVDLDVGFIALSNERNTLNLFVGRKFFTLGTGLVVNGRGDGGEITFYSRFIDIKLFGLYTGLLKKDNNPYGLSDKDITDGAKRIFAGGTLQKEFLNQAFYLLGVAQIDQGDEEEGTKSRYQSQYYGAGLTGTISDMIEYYAEFVYEMGKSYLSGTEEEEDIQAYAANAGIRYYIDVPLNPTLIIQYAYGSGDEDRTSTRLPTANQMDTDTGFLSFGTYVGGYALRPELSNIHIARGGFSFTPFSFTKSRSLKRMNIMVKYSYYMKDKPEGVINYGEATLEEREIGHGIDASLRWGILSDFSFFVTYAIFLPGKAYDSSEPNRNFTMGGFNIIF